jgi:hypothetical protein
MSDDDDTKVIYRSSDTGQIVTKAFAEANPATTERQVVPEGHPGGDELLLLAAQAETAEALERSLGE